MCHRHPAQDDDTSWIKTIKMFRIVAAKQRLLRIKHCTLTSSVSFTRRICSLRSWRSLKVDCAVMEYTRAKPWPFFMYKSLIAVNCSYTREEKEDGRAMSSATQIQISDTFDTLWGLCWPFLMIKYCWLFNLLSHKTINLKMLPSGLWD